jgi:hypothetical protein
MIPNTAIELSHFPISILTATPSSLSTSGVDICRTKYTKYDAGYHNPDDCGYNFPTSHPHLQRSKLQSASLSYSGPEI